jgi:surfeit locus 1 family protein
MSLAMARSRSILALTLAAIAGFAVLIGLGAWQLQRLDEKEAFLGQLKRESKAAARSDWGATPPFGRVSITGSFVQGKTAFVRVTLPAGQGAEPGGLGLYVVSPLKRSDGSVILVNRGFVRTGVENRPMEVALPKGDVTITGFKRPPEPRNWFSVPDDMARLVFAVRDPAVIAAALAVDADRSAFLEAERSGDAVSSGPLGVDAGELLARIPNNHLHYAMTWFGLAATLLGVYLALVLAWRREARQTGGVP